MDGIPPPRRNCNDARSQQLVSVGAGPSLARNIHLLADPAVRRNVVVISAQTTLKPLLDRGIQPDFVTALEWSFPGPKKVLQNIGTTALSARLGGLESFLLSGFRSRRRRTAHQLRQKKPPQICLWGSGYCTALSSHPFG